MSEKWSVSRRAILRAGVGAGIPNLFGGAPGNIWSSVPTVGAQEIASDLVIDLSAEPSTLDPALVYEVDGWSIIHSIYDSLVQFDPDGSLQPVLAESMEQVDPLIWEIRVRDGITFHNGENLDVKSVRFSIERILDPETKTQIAGNFQVIEEIEDVDDLTVRLHLANPAPWLPSQIAPWLALLPPVYASDPANDFANNPVGTGPYIFDSWERGSKVLVHQNPDYFAASPKGRPVAERVSFRFVMDAVTRVADIISNTSQIARGIPVDQVEAVSDAGSAVPEAIAGCAFVRIPTDVEPFSDPRVRLAMNHAVDIDAVITALLAGNGVRLANLFVPGGLGFDESLAAHAYDPELAASLLAEAGFPDGFSTTLAYTPGDQVTAIEAIAGQLGQVGITVDVQPVELATFNATWTDKTAAPLRMLTWRPLFDPFTLLNLVISNTGFLSRYDDPAAQALIDAGAIETDPAKRNQTYQELGRVLHDAPAAIYLWNLTSIYGESNQAPSWTPRPDDWILPLDASEDA